MPQELYGCSAPLNFDRALEVRPAADQGRALAGIDDVDKLVETEADGEGILIAQLHDLVGEGRATEGGVDGDQLADGVAHPRILVGDLPAQDAAQTVADEVDLSDGIAGQVFVQ